MRKGRSISITQWHFVTPDKPRERRCAFSVGVAVWNGERFVGLGPLPIFEQFPDPPEVRTTRLEFLPAERKQLNGVISFEAEQRKKALLKKLTMEADYRAHVRWVNSQDG